MAAPPYNPAGYNPANPATWPQPIPPATLYQPGMAWTMTGPGVVDGQTVAAGDLLYVVHKGRLYGSGTYGSGLYGSPPDGDWSPADVRFVAWYATAAPADQPPFPYSGCKFGDTGWWIIVDCYFGGSPSRHYGEDTYGSGVYGGGTAAGTGWYDITQGFTDLTISRGSADGGPSVDVLEIDGNWFDPDFTKWVVTPPESWERPFVGVPIRVSFYDPNWVWHPRAVGSIEQIVDPTVTPESGQPRIVSVQAFGHVMDLSRNLIQWSRPAETASARFDALLAAGGWRYGTPSLVYPPNANLHADKAPRDVTAIAELDRTALSAGWTFDTDRRGSPRLRVWPLVPGPVTATVVDCATPDTPAVPAVPGYLTGTVGSVSTPDPGPLPAAFVVVFQTRGPTTTGENAVAAQWSSAAGQKSFMLTNRSTGTQRFYYSNDGTANLSKQYIGVAPTGDDETWAVTYQTAGPTTWHRHNGTTWVQMFSVTGAFNLFDSSLPLTIGAASLAASPFAGRIYWCELRTGVDPTAGTVVWRFDANDYPGTGTSYTDPRGRVWTLSNPAAITPTIPAVPAGASGDLVATVVVFTADESQLLNDVAASNDTAVPTVVRAVPDATSVALYGYRDNSLGFPATGLAFADAATGQALVDRVAARYARIVTHVEPVAADTLVDPGWLPVLADVDTGEHLTVTRHHPTPFTLDAVVVGVVERITPGRIETLLSTTTTTPTT